MTPGRDRGTRRGVAWRTDRGSVTAEFALSIPVLVLLLLAGLTAVGAVVTKLQCVDAAREAARAEARGASGEQAGRSARAGRCCDLGPGPTATTSTPR